MKLRSMEKPEVNKAVLTIEVTAEEFESGMDQAYRKNRHNIDVPGFRKGRAPRKVIEAHYGPSVFYDDAISMTYPKAYAEAVVEAELNPVDNPAVELTEFLDEGGYVFTATVDLYPEVKLGEYKGLKAYREKVSVAAEEVDQEISRLQERNARMEPVDRAAQDGDITVIDFEGFLDGVAFDGGKAEQFNLTLGSGSFIPGFEEQLVGMTAGQEKDINITFPEDYNDELGGKDTVFKVKLHEVKEKILPELDDEFAKDVSEFDALDELRADIEKQMLAAKETNAEDVFINDLLLQAAENAEIEVPKIIIDNQVDMMVQEQDMRIQQQQGMTIQQYVDMLGQDMDAVKDGARPSAERIVRTELMLNQVAEAEKLEVSDEEVEEEFSEMAKAYNIDVETVKKSIKVEDIKPNLMRRKAEKLIVDNAVALDEKPEVKAEEGEKPKKVTAKKAAVKKGDAEAAGEEEEKPKKAPVKKPAAKKAEGEAAADGGEEKKTAVKRPAVKKTAEKKSEE